MKTRVLVIDDDASIRESMKKVLQREDYEVLLAADREEALDRFDPQEIDLLLLDLNLPERSGWDVFEEITAKNPCLPVIVITGDPGQYRVAKVAGISAFLEKPIDVPVLLQTLRDLLAEPKEQRLRRLVGRGHRPRRFPSSAQHVFADLRARYATPYQWEPPVGAFPSGKSSHQRKANQRNEHENKHN